MGQNRGSKLLTGALVALVLASGVNLFAQATACPPGNQPSGYTRDAAGNQHIVSCLDAATGQYWFAGQIAQSGGETFDVRAYGAKGDASTDDTAAFEAAWTAAIAAGGSVTIPPGTYILSSTIIKPQSFSGPSIVGSGFQKTIIKYTGAAATAAIDYIGGSGQMSGIKMSGFTIEGTGSQWGIEVDGQDGVLISEVRFENLAVGFVPANYSSGTFSEGDVCDNCSFLNSVITVVRYLIGSGTNSFHGTGLRHAFIQANTTGSPIIIVDNGAMPYDAPFSANIWVDSNQTLIQNNGQPASYPQANWHGSIELETGTTYTLTLADTNPVEFAGNLISFGPNYSLGTMSLWRQLAGYVTSSYGVPENAGQTVALTTGANTIDAGAGYYSQQAQPTATLVYVKLVAANYQYDYLLLIDGAGGGLTPPVTTLANPESYNSAGYGAPTFSLGSGNHLVITNANFPASGVTAYIGSAPIGASSP